MLLSIPHELLGVFYFKNKKPQLKVPHTKEQEKIFQEFVKKLEEEDKKRFIWDEE